MSQLCKINYKLLKLCFLNYGAIPLEFLRQCYLICFIKLQLGLQIFMFILLSARSIRKELKILLINKIWIGLLWKV